MMALTSDVQKARALVDTIVKDRGHLGEATYSRMDPETRRKVEGVLQIKDQLIGSSVITLAKSLYSKDVHFIFELLQNADDNHYENAKEKGQEPYVCFRVYKDQIVVECNEDGFTKANVRAICHIGKSSKVGDHGYIGEKGIGFKSVFKVGWKIHIQSGPFSFCFKHRPGESGMGMISPEWVPDGEIEAGLTRITITLHQSGEGENKTIYAKQRKSIAKQLKHLKPSMLLFLKNLTRIEVHSFDENGTETKALVMTRVKGSTKHRETLKTISTTLVGTTNKTSHFTHHYHVTKGLATGLARNENRDYSSQPPAQLQADSKADVVLAFPLSEDSMPVIEPQELYAFLPIRHVGLSFLVHSDFVTMASREDIVESSPRNQDLLPHLAETFVQAVREMCQDGVLRYEWMRYLPVRSGSHDPGPFWNETFDCIKSKLSNAKIIVAHTAPSKMRSIRQLRWCDPEWYDQHNEPLFDDLADEDAIYISKRYSQAGIDILKTWGLGKATIGQHLLPRVERDLGNKATSKMKSPKTDHDWHSRAAKLLMQLEPRSIESLELLPCQNGMWMSSDQHKLYLPWTTNNIRVPLGLGLKRIHHNAAKHPERQRLFEFAGVAALTSDQVRSRVMKKIRGEEATVDCYVAWTKFLYLTCPMGNTSEYLGQYEEIRFKSVPNYKGEPGEDRISYHPRDKIYIYDKQDEYGPACLGLDVKFLHPKYLKNPPSRSTFNGDKALDWIDWLHHYTGIRTRLELVVGDGDDKLSLSDEFLEVAEHHPEKLIGLLRHLWPYESSKILSSKDIREQLSNIEVLCEGDKMRPLSQTIIPAPQLKKIAARFCCELGQICAFLKLETETTEKNIGSWSFLDNFLVILDDGIRFYLSILGSMPMGILKKPSRTLELYKLVHGKCVASDDSEGAKKLIRLSIDAGSGIYIPDKIPIWSRLNGTCLLGAPADMEHKHPLDCLYEAKFGSTHADLKTINHFFSDTLGIPNLSWGGYIAELRFLKRRLFLNDFDKIKLQYKRLERCDLDTAAIEEMRKIFEDEELIFHQKDGGPAWSSSNYCVWVPGTRLRKRSEPNLADEYDESLEKFFVDMLGVEHLTIGLIIDELMQAEHNELPVRDVKQHLQSLNSLLQNPHDDDDDKAAKQLLEQNNILPVRYPDGTVQLHSTQEEFIIVDRAGSLAPFRNLVKTLDFSMEEAHDLGPLWEWGGLTDCYLSAMVRETPRLGSGSPSCVSDTRLDIKRKAHGLLRVAKYIRSPRYSGDGQTLYQRLCASETWETDDILSELSITLDGRMHFINLEKSEVYISDEQAAPLRIFIPQEETAQDICVQHALPRKLVEWLMMDPETGTRKPPREMEKAVGVVKGLLNARIASVATILTQEGIHEADIPDDHHHEDVQLGQGSVRASSEVDAGSDEETLDEITPILARLHLGAQSPVRPSPARRPVTPLSPSSTGSGISTPPTSRSEAPLFDTNDSIPPLSPFSRPAGTETASPIPSRDPKYTQLLNHVIEAARIPSSRLSVRGDMTDVSPYVRRLSRRSLPFSNPTQSQFTPWELGAAGELFVYEHLKKFQQTVLTGFCLTSWTSKLKSHAKAHPEYRDMRDGVSSPRSEIADLEYRDHSGSFTKHLVELGHLQAEPWLDKKPVYYFEVKSTHHGCDAPFYMSGEQYRKMKRICADDNEIYIIFRVFNMFTDKIDVKLYVNPAGLETRGELRFKTVTEKYTVVPTASGR
ncbi:hypothetical protein QBC43DRAFT_298156 [Cladorrhinum sp. PSN259]|nr:hypothetical protein QBC43DRAFT_298156 [Cladorrhinum sp. PSN259]